MDWTEKQECILCCKRGKLLVCNGDGCPISIHKDCMGCEPYLDDTGNFYCPYCVYKRLTAETCQLREKAMLAKKALSTFLEEQKVDGNHPEPIVGLANKDKHILSEEKVCSMDGSKLISDDVQHQNSKTPFPNGPGEVSGVKNVNSCRVMVVYKPNSNIKEDRMKADQLKSDVSKRIKVDNRNRNGKCKFDGIVNNQQHTTSIEEAAQIKNAGTSLSTKKQVTCQKGNPFAEFNKNADISLSTKKQVTCQKGNPFAEFNKNADISLSTKKQVACQKGNPFAEFNKNADISLSTKKQVACQKGNPFAEFNKNADSRKEECNLEHAAETLVSLATGMQLHSKSNSKIDNDHSDGNVFLKDRRHNRHEPAHLLDHPNGTTKGSLEAKTGVMNCTESINVSNRGVVKDSSKQLSVIDRSIKQRVLWSEEEEDMLKEGVQKFSLLSRKNLPWKKILEFGHHVFDASRNPSDLKDKWRNMAK